MEKSIIATGKTLESAIDAALRQLGMDRDSVSVEIIRNAKSGFLGFGAVDAQVKVTYEAPDEEDAGPKPALSSASRTRPRHVTAPVTAPVPQAPAAPRTPAAPKAPQPQQERRPARQPQEPRPQQERKPQEQRPAPRPAVPAEPVVYTPAAPGSTEERIEAFIKGLLEHMGSDAVPHAVKTGEDSYQVDLVGDRKSVV